MCKSKQKKSSDSNTPEKQDSVRTWSFRIIGFCVFSLLSLLVLMAWRATKNNPEVYRVIVTTDVVPDSLRNYSTITSEQADSLIDAIRTYDNQLTQKYQYLVEQKEQDSQVFYWGSLLVGIVIAVFGWFGFQSFTTIEDKAKSKARSVANREAWKATIKFLNGEGKRVIEDAVKNNLQEEAIKKVKNEVIGELNTIIENRLNQYIETIKLDELQQSVDKIESSIKLEIDKAVSSAVQDVIKKYIKSIRRTAKKQEEEQ